MSKKIRVAFLAGSILIMSAAVSAQTVAVSARNDIELIKLADYFSKYYQYADEARMTEALADDFRYFTNVPCPYKECSLGATKTNYILGILGERKPNGFTVESVNMKYIAPINQTTAESVERKVSFFCTVETESVRIKYKFYSVIDYYFRKSDGVWKITKIENRLIDR